MMAAAVTAPAMLPVLAAAAEPNPDVELLALGRRLDVLADEWLDQALRYRRRLAVSDEEINALCDRLNPLTDDILSRKAQTLAGLAVQAKALSIARTNLWETDD
jgi:hypothetical protein